MKVSRNWLTEYLGDATPTAEEIERLLTFHAFEIEEVEEVGDDAVIDVDVLPNRSSDCLCHRGVARELATLLNVSLKKDPLATISNLPQTDSIAVSIADQSACPRFTACLIEGIEVKDSPQWLKDRLAAIGQRSINNIVDATNYVMFAIGQPLHAYDATAFPQIDGQWRFGVRYARAGEAISLLAEGGKDEDRVIELTGSELLVVDESSDTPIGLAGVKGGRFAGVNESTTRIIIEAAHFDPVVTRKTARRLGIVIDASKRFENEPSRALPPYAQVEIARLITDIAGGNVVGMIDQYLTVKQNPEVAVSHARTEALLGTPITKANMIEILTRIGAAVQETEAGCVATGPFERTDLNIEEDFIEEIGRVFGYQHIAPVEPAPLPVTEINAHHLYSERIRQTLIELGFSEVITSSFVKKDQVSLSNALASDKGCLRSVLSTNLEHVLEKNIRHIDLLGVQDVRVFEIGTVFCKTEQSVVEYSSLCMGVRTKANGYNKKDEEILTLAITELTNTLKADLSFTINQGVAELNFTEVLCKLPTPTAYDPISESTAIQYQPFSHFPHNSRDIALWVEDDATVEAVEKVVNDAAGDLRVRTTLFDEFTKEGRTSYAFRLVFQSNERTLTDEEVNAVMNGVYTAAVEQGWEVR